MPNSGRVSVILPTYNERAGIAYLYPRLAEALSGVPSELWVIDDQSPDGTAEVARSLEGGLPVHVVERTGVRGLATAVLEGFRRAPGEYLAVMDADGSHPAAVLPALLRAVQEGPAEMAIATREAWSGDRPGLALSRRVISSGGRWLARPLTRVRDPMSGYFVVRRSLLDRAPLDPIGYKIGLEILVRCRPDPVAEIPYRFLPRIAGQSKLDRGEIGRYVRHLLRLYRARSVGRADRQARTTR
ncbi:MAG: polyprenol monophosphomannose synthase [Thermoplasmata archaeon]|jgi:dolichol-phosphate mannosyltransferase